MDANENIDAQNHQKVTNRQLPSSNQKQATSNRTSFTDRFKSFSNDIMRTIELAHDVADLHNSKFAHATVAAAQAMSNENKLNEDDEEEPVSQDEKTVDEGTCVTESADVAQNENITEAKNAEQRDQTNETQSQLVDYNKLINNKNNLKVILNETDENVTSQALNNRTDSITSLITTTTATQKLSKSNSSILNTEEAKNEEKVPLNMHISTDTIYLSTTNIDEKPVANVSNVDFRVRRHEKRLTRSESKTQIPDGIYISIWEVFIYLWGCIAFFIDIVSDIILSVGYYKSNKKWLCALTLLFVIVPNVTLSLFSLSWYIDTYYTIKNRGKPRKTNGLTNQPLQTPNANTSPHSDSYDHVDIGNTRRTSAQHHYKSNHLDDTYELNSLNSFNDNRNSQNTASTIYNQKSTFDSITFWITTIIFLVLQLDLVYKYIQGFYYTLKGWVYRTFYHNKRWEKYYIEKQIKCDTDIGMLRLIDVFMDSGPQVLLQLYVITTQKLSNDNLDITNGGGSSVGAIAALTANSFDHHRSHMLLPQHHQSVAPSMITTWSDFLNQENRLVLKQVFSISSSLFSMGYALAGYHRCLRNQQYLFCVNQNKQLIKPISWWATIMQFLWYLFLISPRVLSMALFASTFRSWFFMIIFVHLLIMYFWILNLKTNYCITSSSQYNAREEIFEKFYNFVCSFIYIFAYFNLKSGSTRYRYLVYYIIFYLENILFSISYYCFSNEKNQFFKIFMLSIILVGFWFAIIFQILYYLYFHPSQDIRLCVRKNKKLHFIHVNTLRATKLKKLKQMKMQEQQQQQPQQQSKSSNSQNLTVTPPNNNIKPSMTTTSRFGSYVNLNTSSNTSVSNSNGDVEKRRSNSELNINKKDKHETSFKRFKRVSNNFLKRMSSTNIALTSRNSNNLPRIVVTDVPVSPIKAINEGINEDEDDNVKFEYKLFHLNDTNQSKTTPVVTPSNSSSTNNEIETPRGNLTNTNGLHNQNLNGSVGSIVSVATNRSLTSTPTSSLYYSIKGNKNNVIIPHTVSTHSLSPPQSMAVDSQSSVSNSLYGSYISLNEQQLSREEQHSKHDFHKYNPLFQNYRLNSLNCNRFDINKQIEQLQSKETFL